MIKMTMILEHGNKMIMVTLDNIYQPTWINHYDHEHGNKMIKIIMIHSLPPPGNNNDHDGGGRLHAFAFVNRKNNIQCIL